PGYTAAVGDMLGRVGKRRADFIRREVAKVSDAESIGELIARANRVADAEIAALQVKIRAGFKKPLTIHLDSQLVTSQDIYLAWVTALQ
ncbi:MAG: hypothetical protein H0X45_01590, partial [Planctomycetes bacterium]|nr:hypothetical protein [Planctomycetota bacterium]